MRWLRQLPHDHRTPPSHGIGTARALSMARALSTAHGLSTARGIALFLGLFGLTNIVGDWISPGFDANLWWIDVRRLPPTPARLLLGASTVVLAAFGIAPRPRGWRRWLTVGSAAALILVSLENTLRFYALASRGGVSLGIPVPLTLVTAIALLAVLIAAWRPRRNDTPTPTARSQTILALVTLALAAFAFPLLQMFLFGKTDYRRPADVAIVFGARAYADGRPSHALRDRVTTACALHRTGLVGTLIFSGGPGDGPVHETEAMRNLALSLGVPDSAIVLDNNGLSTRETVANAAPLLEARGWRRVLAVSHFYHLPRVKMSFQRRGIEVYTVPATEVYVLTKLPYLMLREVAALWAYYLTAGLTKGTDDHSRASGSS